MYLGQILNTSMKRLIFTLCLLLASALSPVAFADEVKDLERTTKEWQQKLQLTDWTITVRPVPMLVVQMIRQGKPAAALSLWDLETRNGIIFIVMRADYPKTMPMAKIKADQRDSVVHEMLHNIIEHAPLETGIGIISKALKP